ncbi:MAG: ABC transporter permease [Methanomassiliicoccaceae archaeon]|nr:ABC transporter permease [Methanomassiliicoccaceae archaeon]
MPFVSDRMRVIRSSFVMSIHDTFTTVRPSIWIIQLIVPSLFAMFFFSMMATWAGADPEFVIIGNAVQSIGITTIYAVAGIPGTQKHIGTMTSLAVTPSSLFSIFFGMSIFGIIAGFMSIAVSLTAAAFIFGVNMASINLFSAVIVIVLTAFSVGGISMTISSVGIYLRTSAIIANIAAYIGLVLCGVNFPVSDLPGWAQTIAHCHPLTYAVEATRGAVNGNGIMDMASTWSDPIPMMIILGIIFIIVSLLTFGFFEKLSRNSSKMDTF